MGCGETEQLVNNTAFQLVLGSQAIAGFLSGVVSVIVTIKCGTLHFHVNCRTTQVVRYRTYSDPCSVGLPQFVCIGLRFPATVCMTSFALLQFAMVAERSIALWKRNNYETYGPRLGIMFAVVSVIIALAATTWAMWQEDFHQSPVYCSAATINTADRLSLLCFVICGIDLTTLIGVAVLFTCNDIAVKRKHFNLNSSYQLHENYSVIRLILPLTLFQTVCYAVFSGSSGIISLFRHSFGIIGYRTLFAATYIIPYYTFISPILMWFVIRYSQRLKATKLKLLTQRVSSENDVYFKTYSEMNHTGTIL
ncbi:hypothetical protein Y032_0095g2811 [Ancylostoma ceylanicum]|uniref:G-protein coupled receptors family 1 profile domain-containing protein n=1 Tax=Ancylostoma ceylanicum TaxID=53326 RepID=A0A016TKT1_9BILA|nr:hypothetical protein Y032_0095g2811 [Ancylostoma ceylanicum]